MDNQWDVIEKYGDDYRKPVWVYIYLFFVFTLYTIYQFINYNIY